ncbi:MAG: hypothetical protein P4M15_09955 [Alphaproteobacteria bacterium]|nr:hypothetical protein [Alphaproteobacteria bacterium]
MQKNALITSIFIAASLAVTTPVAAGFRVHLSLPHIHINVPHISVPPLNKIVPDIAKPLEKVLQVPAQVIEKGGDAITKVLTKTNENATSGLQDLSKGTEKLGDNVATVLHDTGHDAKKIQTYLKEHPAVAAGVVLITGGYLVAVGAVGFSFTLSLEGLPVVTLSSAAGTTVGGVNLVDIAATDIAVGAAEGAAGAGVIYMDVTKPKDPPQPTTDTPGQPVKIQSSDAGGVAKNAAKGADVSDAAAQAVDYQKSIMYAPRLPDNAGEYQKLDFAEAVYKWSRQEWAVADFARYNDGEISPAEQKLMEALATLYSIQDAESDEIIRDQSERNIALSYITEQGIGFGEEKVMDLALLKLTGTVVAGEIFSKAMMGIALFQGDTLTDGVSMARDRDIHMIEAQLAAYAEVRLGRAPGAINLRLPPMRPAGDIFLPPHTSTVVRPMP